MFTKRSCICLTFSSLGLVACVNLMPHSFISDNRSGTLDKVTSLVSESPDRGGRPSPRVAGGVCGSLRRG